MEKQAAEILNGHRGLTIATLRADGSPQATMVNYANDGLLLYFVLSRQSQEYANIQRDSRVSIVVGRNFKNSSRIEALSIAANASEVRDPKQRERAIHLLSQTHPGLSEILHSHTRHSAIMRAYCSVVTLLDYTSSLGHNDVLTVERGGVEMSPACDNDWRSFAAMAEV